MNFIKSFWRFIQKIQSFVGTFLFLIILVIFSAFILSTVVFDGPAEKTKPEHSALVISFRGAIVEQEAYSDDPYQQLLSGGLKANTLLRDVVKTIELAALDDDISTLVLNFDKFSGAYPSKLHYIGQKISEFKKTGKKVISYASQYDQSAYLLASYSDEIYLHPQGAVLLYGYGSYQNYFQGFLTKIKAEVQLFRVGKYKSAMEPFIRSDMSDEARLENIELYGGLWDQYISRISTERAISEDVIRNGIENADQLLMDLGGDFGKLAFDNSLVDGLKTRAQWVSYMQELVGKGKDDKGINQIGYKSYLASNSALSELRGTFAKGHDIIAVVYATGTIMDGTMPQGTVGGDTLSRQLREARFDDDVKAVVLRVDSPGGSAFASEIIRQEVLLLKRAGKPVVVSMGSVAASGGYWISANADEIWASPTTITGSIGIFGAVPNLEGTLGAIGITTDGVATSPLIAAGFSKPLPQKLKNIIQSNIENGYQRFLELVAEGRHMTVEQVNEIGQGRVWTGLKAKEIGLVDQLGNIDQAILSAADMAELKDYKVVYWEDEIPLELQVLAKLFNGEGQSLAKMATKTKQPAQILMDRILDKLSLFNMMNDPNNAYVLCVNCMGGFNSEY